MAPPVISGKFQMMIPPPAPPQYLHPTITGTIVVWPSFSVVSQVFSVHAGLLLVLRDTSLARSVAVVVREGAPLVVSVEASVIVPLVEEVADGPVVSAAVPGEADVPVSVADNVEEPVPEPEVSDPVDVLDKESDALSKLAESDPVLEVVVVTSPVPINSSLDEELLSVEPLSVEEVADESVEDESVELLLSIESVEDESVAVLLSVEDVEEESVEDASVEVLLSVDDVEDSVELLLSVEDVDESVEELLSVDDVELTSVELLDEDEDEDDDDVLGSSVVNGAGSSVDVGTASGVTIGAES